MHASVLVRAVEEHSVVDLPDVKAIDAFRPLHRPAQSDHRQHGLAVFVHGALVRRQLLPRTPFYGPVLAGMRPELAFDPEPPSRGYLPETEVGKLHAANVASIRLVIPRSAVDEFEERRVEHLGHRVLEVVAQSVEEVAPTLLFGTFRPETLLLLAPPAHVCAYAVVYA